MLLKEIDEEMTPAEFRGNELGMKALGLIPRDINLKEVMVQVYSEEIAAFYDPKTKTMHLIRSPRPRRRSRRRFLERSWARRAGSTRTRTRRSSPTS